MAKKPGPVTKEALAYFRDKDLRVGFNYQDVWQQEHAHAFTVAKAMRLDVLEDIRGALDDALANGKTFRDFAKELTPTLQEKGWWGIKETIDPATGEKTLAQLGSPRRLKVIHDANMHAARAAGQWQRIQRSKRALPFLIYERSPSREPREEHARWAGTILPVDHPWWRTHYPPNDYGCKCRVRQATEAEAQNLIDGGKSLAGNEYSGEPPPEKPVRYVNKRTGETAKVDKGLSPAWANNAGQDRVRVIREQLANKIDSVDQHRARAAVRNVLDSPVLDAWIKDHQGEIPAGIIDRDIQRALGAKTQTARLSDQTFKKQDAHHPELTVAEYRLMPRVIDEGIAILDGNHVTLYREIDGQWWRAVLKSTQDRQRNYLVSFTKSRAAQVGRAHKRGKVIRSVQKGGQEKGRS